MNEGFTVESLESCGTGVNVTVGNVLGTEERIEINGSGRLKMEKSR